MRCVTQRCDGTCPACRVNNAQDEAVHLAYVHGALDAVHALASVTAVVITPRSRSLSAHTVQGWALNGIRAFLERLAQRGDPISERVPRGEAFMHELERYRTWCEAHERGKR